jgi:hypothetical protein
LKGADVVAEMTLLPGTKITVHETCMTTEETIADPIAVEQSSQEECQGVTHRISLTSELAKTNSESLNLTLVRDEFDADTLDKNLDNEQHVEKNDEIASNESDEENMQPSVDRAPDVPVAQVMKAMRQMCPPQRLLYVMSRYQVTLTGVHITKMKS